MRVGTWERKFLESVTPVHKGIGNIYRDDKSNYRPALVMPIMSKLLEKYFCEQLCNHLKDDELHQLQSGFRKLFFDRDSIDSINRSIIP